MNYIFDACTIIFLTNVALLKRILSIPGKSWFIGQTVVDECFENGNLIPELQLALNNGEINLLDGSNLDAIKYLENLDLHGLGEGETECLTYASESDFIVCTDDMRARKIISTQCGQDRVTGTLGLLAEAVKVNLITSSDAMAKYNLMKSGGAFLPTIPSDFFD